MDGVTGVKIRVRESNEEPLRNLEIKGRGSELETRHMRDIMGKERTGFHDGHMRGFGGRGKEVYGPEKTLVILKCGCQLRAWV